MKYLVLRRFFTMGKLLIKGMVVDESEIRSPRLRMIEGKIVPAVSSSTVPAEPGDEPDQQGIQEEEDKPEQPAEQQAAQEPEKPRPRLSFKG